MKSKIKSTVLAVVAVLALVLFTVFTVKPAGAQPAGDACVLFSETFNDAFKAEAAEKGFKFVVVEEEAKVKEIMDRVEAVYGPAPFKVTQIAMTHKDGEPIIRLALASGGCLKGVLALPVQ